MSPLNGPPAPLRSRWAEAAAQIAKAEAKLLLVAFCAALLWLPASVFFALHAGNVDVDLSVRACKAELAGEIQGWARKQRPGVTVGVSPFPGSGVAVSTDATKYDVHYAAADRSLRFAIAAENRGDLRSR